MKIKIYSQNYCPQCSVLKNILKEKHIGFDECMDVNEMRSRGISHTPMIEIDEELYDMAYVLKLINEGRM